MLFFCFLAPVCCCPFFLSFHHSRPPLKSFSSFKSDQETFFLSFYLGVKMVRKKKNSFFMCDWLLIFVYMFSLKGEERKDRQGLYTFTQVMYHERPGDEEEKRFFFLFKIKNSRDQCHQRVAQALLLLFFLAYQKFCIVKQP